MDLDTLIAARPHFRQRGNELYFFLSDRVYHSLRPAEAKLWRKLQDGPVVLKDLGGAAAVQTLLESRLVEAIAPVRRTNRRKILVVEPHSDDAALSIGATMWKMRNEAEFHLLTMASRSNYTSSFHLHREYFDRLQVTAMRTAEGDLFTRHLGGYYHCAGMTEATLRYHDSDWTLPFFKAHEVSVAIFNNRRGHPALLGAWVEKLQEFCRGDRFEEIWIPLGAGTHGDHDLARNAALQVIVEGHGAPVVRLYEDVPYGGEFQEHTDRILHQLSQAGAMLTPWWQDVTEEFPTKLSLLNIFASQFKVSSIQAGVERSARLGAHANKVERLWTVDVLPHRLPRDEMWIGAPEVANASADLASFRKGSTETRRVAVFAISAAGRWAEDLRHLKELFPNARFAVHSGPQVIAEFRTVQDDRVELHGLDGRPWSWIRAALREFTSGHRIVVAGGGLRKAEMLARIWPVGRTIIVSAMDHLIQALPEGSASKL